MIPRFDVIRYGPQAEQFGELWSPSGAGPHPVVMLLHGGFWRRRYGLDIMHGLADDLRRRGMAAWNVEYRRVGSPGGGWPGTFDDVAAAYDALDPEPAAIVGHSAGGHLALWLGARRRPGVVVALAGVCDLEAAGWLHLSHDAVNELLGGNRPERRRAADPVALVPLGVRQVLLHGTADDIVPVSVSRSYAAAAEAAGDDCTLVELPGVDHFAFLDPASGAWALAVSALGI